MKYRSISEHIHTVVISGKKYIVRPGDIFESSIPLNYVFLEQVEDTAKPTTLRQSTFQSVKSKLDSLEQDKNAVNEKVSSQVNERVEYLADLIQQLKSQVSSDIQKVVDDVNESLSEFKATQDHSTASIDEFKKTTNRRLSILKEAVQSIENEVYGDLDSDPK
jgi:DNA anti-recombination protein RmuC